VDIRVEYVAGDSFSVRLGHHELLVDQPVHAGGTDTGPTPTDLFVASLAACIAFYAERFLRRHDLKVEGLSVRAGFEMSQDRPARVTAIDLDVRLPDGFPEERRAALMAVVDHCTVHNSIRQAPEVRIELGRPEPVTEAA
jgi:putative redox protein